jgi:hypothetical protein
MKVVVPGFDVRYHERAMAIRFAGGAAVDVNLAARARRAHGYLRQRGRARLVSRPGGAKSARQQQESESETKA